MRSSLHLDPEGRLCENCTQLKIWAAVKCFLSRSVDRQHINLLIISFRVLQRETQDLTCEKKDSTWFVLCCVVEEVTGSRAFHSCLIGFQLESEYLFTYLGTVCEKV